MPERSKLAQRLGTTKLAFVELHHQVVALSNNVGAYKLPDVALVQVQGPDARSWLNGQISNNISLPQAGRAIYAVAPSAKGKILSDLWVFDRDSELWLVLPAKARPGLIQQFKKYIFMEEVSLHTVDDYLVWTLQGPKAATVGDQLSVTDLRLFKSDRLGYGGVDLLLPQAQEDLLLNVLSPLVDAAGGAIVTEAAWEISQLRQGIPRFGIDFDSQHYPQEAAIAQRAVSFTKGCYIGQEVIAMLEHRGKLKRQLVKVQAPQSVELAAGNALYSSDQTMVGTISSAAVDVERRCTVGLTMLATSFLAENCEAFTDNGAKLSIAPVD